MAQTPDIGQADGVLRWKHVTLAGLTYPAASTISAQLAAPAPIH
jgi:hypothetical protein